MASYELRQTEKGDVASLSALYTRLTGRARSESQYAWEWRDGPYGPAPSWVIVDRKNGRLVGHHGVVPVPLWHRDHVIMAARTENTMLDPDYRGQLVYPAYEATILQQLLPRFSIIFTTAGGGAPGTVRRRLGYAEVGGWRTFTAAAPFGWLARRFFGPVAGHAARLFPIARPRGWTIAESRDLGRVEALWTRVRGSYPLAAERSAIHLDWRLARNPYHSYTLAMAQHGGIDRGFVAWRERKAPNGMRDTWIEDIFVDTQDAYAPILAAVAAHVGGSSRVLVRSVECSDSLPKALGRMGAFWARNRGQGSPFLARSTERGLDLSRWQITSLITEGI